MICWEQIKVLSYQNISEPESQQVIHTCPGAYIYAQFIIHMHVILGECR